MAMRETERHAMPLPPRVCCGVYLSPEGVGLGVVLRLQRITVSQSGAHIVKQVSFYISSADAMMVNEPWPPRLPTYLPTYPYKETVTKLHPYMGS